MKELKIKEQHLRLFIIVFGLFVLLFTSCSFNTEEYSRETYYDSIEVIYSNGDIDTLESWYMEGFKNIKLEEGDLMRCIDTNRYRTRSYAIYETIACGVRSFKLL